LHIHFLFFSFCLHFVFIVIFCVLNLHIVLPSSHVQAPKRSFQQALEGDRDAMLTEPSSSLLGHLSPSAPLSPFSVTTPVAKRPRYEPEPATPPIGGYNSLAVTQKIMSALKRPTALV
jgi:hypothetical protein